MRYNAHPKISYVRRIRIDVSNRAFCPYSQVVAATLPDQPMLAAYISLVVVQGKRP